MRLYETTLKVKRTYNIFLCFVMNKPSQIIRELSDSVGSFKGSINKMRIN